MEKISVDKLHDLLPDLSPDELVLDVRTPAEFAEGHIQGARNVDHEKVAEVAEDLKQYKTV